MRRWRASPTVIREFAEVDDPDQAARYGVQTPFGHAHFDVVLQLAS